MYVNPIEIEILRGYTENALTDPNPAMRAFYRQLAIQKAESMNIKLTPDDFPVLPGKTPENTGDNATDNAPETAGNEKEPVPDRLPEYPGECPICALEMKSHYSWLGHKKVHH